MNLLADECCDAELVEALRREGHDVIYVVESMRGAPDTAVLDRSYREQRILLTEDKDFGDLVYRLRLPVFGLVLLRFASTESKRKADRLLTLLDRHASRLPRAFIVLEPDRTRIRPLQTG